MDLQQDVYCMEICLKEAIDLEYIGMDGMETYKNVLSIQVDSVEDMIYVSTDQAEDGETISYGALAGSSVALPEELTGMIQNE